MNNLLKLFLIISVNYLTAQNSVKEFIIADYSYNEEENVAYKNIDLDSSLIDFNFMKKHFNTPYYFPDKFVDFKYKNETITVWRDENEIKDNFKSSNWSHTYKYDLKSRIIEFSYSGCLVCSNLAYNFRVTYDENGRVIELKNIISKKQKFKIRYNSCGDIKELISFTSENKLKKRILLKE